jgi:hypothetical protein
LSIKLRCLSALALVLSVAACEDQNAPMAPVDGAIAEVGPAVDGTLGGTGGSAGAVGDAGVAGDVLGVECMPAVHPGTVTFVDEDTGVTKVEDAATVPDSIKWHATSTGRVPVVKVVKHKLSSGQIELLLYGPCAQLLEVVIGMT